MNIKDKLISTGTWLLVVLRVFLSLIAIFILHPLVIGGVIYTSLLFLFFHDNSLLDGLKAWGQMDNKWLAPNMFEQMRVVYTPLMEQHPGAAWFGLILTIIIWVFMWITLAYALRRLVKANLLRLKGWNNGVIIHNTREISKSGFTFEGFSYLSDELTTMLRDRKLFETKKNSNGKKVTKEVQYSIEKKLLGEYIISIDGIDTTSGFGKYTFNLPEVNYDVKIERFKESLERWREDIKEWRKFKIGPKPIRPIHPTLHTNMKLFGDIELVDESKYDYDNLTSNKKEVKEAIRIAKWFIEQYNDRLSRSKVILSDIDDIEKAKQVTEKKLKTEDNIRLWKSNLLKAKKHKKSLSKNT